MKLPEIDWDRIDTILARADELCASGRIDCSTWVALVKEFGEASHGRLELPANLGRMAERAWFDVLHRQSSERVA
jgi:hypothetical protein